MPEIIQFLKRIIHPKGKRTDTHTGGAQEVEQTKDSTQKTMAPENQAAWLPASQVPQLEVGPAPYTNPGPGQIVIKNSALGINPVDWAKQAYGDAFLAHVTYPAILGEDVAGTVAAVGGGVSRFRVGDRVLAITPSIITNASAEGAFQLYTVAREWLTTPLPENVTFEQAVALPLAVLTSGVGLFDKNYLGLDLPTVPKRPTPTGSDGKPSRAVIIAGGASAVGSAAIQLVVAAGYEVVATASPKNFDFVKKLGASQVFDYKSPSIADDLSAAVSGRELFGCYSLGDGSADVFAKVLNQHKGPGSTKKVIALAGGSHNVESDSGVEVKFVFMTPDLLGPECPVRPIFQDYLPVALAKGETVPALKSQVVAKGLDKIQDAMNTHKEGVSATKIVVTL